MLQVRLSPRLESFSPTLKTKMMISMSGRPNSYDEPFA